MKTAPLLALTTAALLAPAGAAHAAPKLGPVDYKVVSVTHTSSSTFADEHYTGTSTASWKLAEASTFRMNWMAGGLYSGTGRLNVRGTYRLDATSDVPGRCVFDAPTGDATHPAVAPAPFDLTVAPDARRPGKALVGFLAVQATLKGPYSGTECTPSADEPGWKEMQAIDVAPARLRGKTIRLTFQGHRAGGPGAAAYDWKTTIVLKRMR